MITINGETLHKDVAKLAKAIMDGEDSMDWSMRGVIMDMVATQYVAARGQKFCEMFEYIMENQKDEYESYGDIDSSVTKIPVTKLKGEYSHYDYTATAMLLNDIFCNRIFVIIKVIATAKGLSQMVDITYHVREVDKELKSVSYEEYCGHHNWMDKGYVVTYVHKFMHDKIEVERHRGQLAFMEKFDAAYGVMTQPFIEIEENLKNNDK